MTRQSAQGTVGSWRYRNPASGALGLIGSTRSPRERAVIAFYEVRGIGSLYYLAYASTHVEFVDEGALWALVAFTIFASTVIHGLTARTAVGLLGPAADRADDAGEPASPS